MFYFRLALSLGMTVGELLARVSSLELSEWMAYAGIEPWGEERADWRAGLITAAVYNVHRDPKRQSKPLTPADFMPKFDEDKPQGQSWQAQLAMVELLNAAFGGDDLR